MKYKALLLDIDDTLYCYDSAHSAANKSVVDFFKDELDINETTVISAYKKARIKTHIDLSETAASHNRLLYFQKMCESFEVNPLKNAVKLYKLYWDIYLGWKIKQN